MIDILLHTGASNALVSALLALVAWFVHRRSKTPRLAYFLWLLVIAKLITPPLMSLPVLPNLDHAASVIELSPLDETLLTGAALELLPGEELLTEATSLESAMSWLAGNASVLLFTLWLAGALVLAGVTIVRVRRFQRLLHMASRPASRELQKLASTVASTLGLARTPRVCTTTANLSPMVWCGGGRVRIVIPEALLDELGETELRFVLAHELAHIVRRDHVVRWLESVACVLFWWNPVVWIARRELRVNEEICCDALVLAHLSPNPKSYANTLLSVVEFLATPAFRPPALASAIHNGGSLQRRFTMILSQTIPTRASNTLRAAGFVCAASFLPLGLAFANGDPSVEKREPQVEHASEDPLVQSLRDLLSSGELTLAEARAIFVAIPLVDSPALSDIEPQLAQVRKKLEAAVAVGQLTEDESKAKLRYVSDELIAKYFYTEVAGLDGRQARIQSALDSGKLSAEEAEQKLKKSEHAARKPARKSSSEWMLEPLENAGIPREMLPDVVGGITKCAHEMRVEGEQFEMDPRLREHFDILGLNPEQMELVLLFAKKTASMPDRDPRPVPIEWMREHLLKAGIAPERVSDVLGGIGKLIHEMQTEREHFEMHPRLVEYFHSLGLTEKQFEVAHALAKRAATVNTREHASEESLKWMAEHLVEAGVPRESIGQVLSAAKQIVHELATEGESHEVDLKVYEYLVSLGLSENQIKVVNELSARAAAHLKSLKDHSNHEEQAKVMREVERDIHAAIEAGELTREEGHAKLKAIHEHFERQQGEQHRGGEHERNHDGADGHDK